MTMKTLLNIWLDDQGAIQAQTDYHFDKSFKRADLKDWEDGRYHQLAHFLQARESTPFRRMVMLLNDARTDPRLDYQYNHPGLENALLAWRRQIASDKHIPAYRVLNMKTLLSLADAAPTTPSELMDVPGIGLGLTELYGEDLLRLISDHLQNESER